MDLLFLSEQIDDIIHDLDDWKEPVNPIPLDVRHEMALFFQAAGVRPTWSTNIGDELNAGYGRLDPNGFWEYPL